MPRWGFALSIVFAMGTTAALAAADFAPATTATNQLGLELFRQLAATKPGENLLLSPYSIQSALAMTYAGADGDTRTEMARVLHFPADDATLAASFGAIRDAITATVAKSSTLASRQARTGGKPDTIEWHLANRLFGQNDFAFRAPFLAYVRDRFAAPLQPMDFQADPEAARITINAWAEEQTRQKIRDLIPPHGVDNTTRLVLVNALYLKAPWEDAFKTELTGDSPFRVRGADSVAVPTMLQTFHPGYARRSGYTALTLPYLGGDLQFLILLPDDPDGVAALADKLTPALLQSCAKLSPGLVTLFLPKFRLAAPTLPLSEMLKSLGMKTAFDVPTGSANFDRMAPRQPDRYLYISQVFHKTYLALDEAGTEASAATAVDMGLGGAASSNQPKPTIVHVDHPFLFAIQHRESGACLFLGRVMDPR